MSCCVTRRCLNLFVGCPITIGVDHIGRSGNPGDGLGTVGIDLPEFCLEHPIASLFLAIKHPLIGGDFLGCGRIELGDLPVALVLLGG
jgi:hypothetical protein